jgi:hypothetical protein
MALPWRQRQSPLRVLPTRVATDKQENRLHQLIYALIDHALQTCFARRVQPHPDDAAIFALERPQPALWKLYLIRVILTGPAFFITLPVLYFRYHTLRYRFDNEGIHMKSASCFGAR